MNKHPYLRAYLAGIACPTVFLLIVVTGYAVIRYVYNVPIPVERVIMFPMAVVPNLWGLWNILFVAYRERTKMSVGLHGAALPFLLAPLGIAMAAILNFSIPHFALSIFPFAAPVALIVYYLAWKHLVGFLNTELGIA